MAESAISDRESAPKPRKVSDWHLLNGAECPHSRAAWIHRTHGSRLDLVRCLEMGDAVPRGSSKDLNGQRNTFQAWAIRQSEDEV